MLRLNPNITAAIESFRAGQVGAAETICRQLLVQAPSDLQALILLGTLCRSQGRVREAIILLENAAKVDNTLAAIFYNLGNAYKDISSFYNSIAAYQKSLCLDPRQSSASNNLGLCYWSIGLLEQAKHCFFYASTLNPTEYGIQLNMGHVLAELGLYSDAHNVYSSIIQSDPSNCAALVALSQALIELHSFADAASILDRALQSCPADHQSLINLIACWTRTGLVARAESFCQSLMASPQATSSLKFLFSALLFYDDSVMLSHLGQAVQCDPITSIYGCLKSLRSVIKINPSYSRAYCLAFDFLLNQAGVNYLDSTEVLGRFRHPLVFSGFGPLPLVSSYAPNTFRGSDFVRFSGPFASDINHLDGVGHFYLVFGVKLPEPLCCINKTFVLHAEVQFSPECDIEPHICLGFSSPPSYESADHQISHAYCIMKRISNGVYESTAVQGSIYDLGINRAHWTHAKYASRDPVLSAQHVSDVFVFVHSDGRPSSAIGCMTVNSLQIQSRHN